MSAKKFLHFEAHGWKMVEAKKVRTLASGRFQGRWILRAVDGDGSRLLPDIQDPYLQQTLQHEEVFDISVNIRRVRLTLLLSRGAVVFVGLAE